MIDIDVIKGIILTALLFTTLLFSMLPLLIMHKIRRTIDPSKRHSHERIISFLSCFGGGVFLGTCFLDLFPEVRNQFVNITSKYPLSSYPLAEFVMIFGFLLILVIEQVTLSWKEKRPELQPLLGHTHSVQRRQSAESHASADHSIHEDPSSHSNLRALLLVFALSLHSIFEGLAIGLQPSVDDTLKIFVAVAIHKSILAFTVGLNLVQSKLHLSTCIFCNLLFSFMSPVGIAIGIAISNTSKSITMSVVNGVLQGIACGSFLYVTFFEVLLHELNNSADRLLKLLFVVLGFSGISVIVGFNPS